MNPESQATESPISRQAQWIAAYRPTLRFSERGFVHSVGDGVAWVSGLPSAAMEEMLDFADGSEGLIFRLAPDLAGVVLLRESPSLAAGTEVTLTGRRLSIPVGDGLLGRVIDPLGHPLDGGPTPALARRRDLDLPSPPITQRTFVSRPLYTGIKVIDTMLPIGRGQRQLVVGDNGVGKSSLALDMVLHQKTQGTKCVYVLVGQKSSMVIQVRDTLAKLGAMEYTTLVVAEATALPGLKYLAPFAGCAIAEEWMWNGQDTLVIYDDLSTHARTYREVSLILRRPPGREAYPADIFFLHSRLLERATQLAADSGGGSMTALPIVETKQGELATYIPTNLISITDGQFFLDRRLCAAGIMPAIDVSRSVSRIGGKAQHPHIKDIAGKIKLDYLQFLELELFTRFGTRLEAATELKIHRGRILREILKQEQRRPMPIEHQLAWLIAFHEGHFDQAELGDIEDLLEALARGQSAFGLKLSDSREVWSRAVAGWLTQPVERQTGGSP